jgi:polyhydroxybutyrate depolymerase
MKTPRSSLRGVGLGLAMLSLGALVSAFGAGCAGPEPEPIDEGKSQSPLPPDPNRLVPTKAEEAAAAPLIAARPYDTTIPTNYSDKKPWPLVILLHGYGASGAAQELLFGLGREASRLGYLFALPDGTVDKDGKRFWNATDACCDLGQTGVDDVAYVDALITDMAARYSVDKRRVFLVGHSNGGFMSYRMACDRSERIAAFVSLAGANFANTTRCKPSEPVAALQVHGDMDTAVPYQGGTNGTRTVPSAQQSVAFFAQLGGCGATPVPGSDIDVDDDLAGNETKVQRWEGCKRGGAELWTIVKGSHVPILRRPGWAEQVWTWLSAHAKP